MNSIYVLDRIEQRHPDITKEDAAHAWEHCIRSMPRLGVEPEEHVGIGYDESGRLLEVVAIRNVNGDWLVSIVWFEEKTSVLRCGRRSA